MAAARSESSAGTAAAAATVTAHNPLEAFFEADRSPEDDKPVVYGMMLCLSLSHSLSGALSLLWCCCLYCDSILAWLRYLLNSIPSIDT